MAWRWDDVAPELYARLEDAPHHQGFYEDGDWLLPSGGPGDAAVGYGAGSSSVLSLPGELERAASPTSSEIPAPVLVGVPQPSLLRRANGWACGVGNEPPTGAGT